MKTDKELKAWRPSRTRATIRKNLQYRELTKKNVRKWRDLVNAGRTMVPSEMISVGDEKSGGQDNNPSEKGQNKKEKTVEKKSKEF